jgi:hypothetical protein
MAGESKGTMRYQQKRGQGSPNPIKQAKLRIRLVYPPDDVLPFADITNRPAKNIDYTLLIDGKKVEGKNGNKTDSQGVLEADIPANAKSGKLTLHMATQNDKKESEFWRINLDIGDLEGPDTVKGQQARLKNLGLFISEGLDGNEGAQFRRAHLRFRTLFGPYGWLTSPDRIKEVYGS